jgi:3-deoxy-7-phosphoheptulonate synthase
MEPTNNLRVAHIMRLETPNGLRQKLPVTEAAANLVAGSRHNIAGVLEGWDRRLLVIVGPCSIHDPEAALDYAERLAPVRERLGEELLICMRVYFEKPRTTIGWKGLINDPHLDGSCDVPTGLFLARQLLLDLAQRGVPAATETLDPVSAQYFSDVISWTAIGARTTESQIHREMASGLSMPVGFKNGTDGGLTIVVDAMQAARAPHSFVGIDGAGQVSVVRTTGNQHCHAVLRGGSSGPNYGAASVRAAADKLTAAGLNPRVLIDCSHANSGKQHHNQPKVLADVAEQLAAGSEHVLGVMLESHLVAGRQDLEPGRPLTYGQSITDACIDFDTTVGLLEQLAMVRRPEWSGGPQPSRTGGTVTDQRAPAGGAMR